VINEFFVSWRSKGAAARQLERPTTCIIMTNSPSTREDAAARFFAKVREIEIGVLTTVGLDGTLHGRPMVTRFEGATDDLLFYVSDPSLKTAEVEADRHVSVSYVDIADQWYGVARGRAKVEHDENLLRRLWTPSMSAWFPKGPDDPDLALLRVKITGAEYWDAPSATMIEILAAVQAGRDDLPPMQTGEHRKL
jgi:general stress protein 26